MYSSWETDLYLLGCDGVFGLIPVSEGLQRLDLHSQAILEVILFWLPDTERTKILVTPLATVSHPRTLSCQDTVVRTSISQWWGFKIVTCWSVDMYFPCDGQTIRFLGTHFYQSLNYNPRHCWCILLPYTIIYYMYTNYLAILSVVCTTKNQIRSVNKELKTAWVLKQVGWGGKLQ